MDKLMEIFHASSEAFTHIVFNCQQGAGRSTTGMVAGMIYLYDAQ
jgi:hypothetical protein